MKVWRISRQRHAATAFSGEGARLASARWNPAGIPLVYTSMSLSLAMVEVFVNLDPPEDPGDLVSIEAMLPINETEAERIDLKKLPGDWKRGSRAITQRIGKEWVLSGRSLVLIVPSAAVAGEWNVLINPAHRKAVDIKVTRPEPFQFDPRMFRSNIQPL